jgi:RHH-type proline utilization regulon transcriptional repressor/proline dehydrogenase/delta 1-pyrroline-5-carboxylate dehydrogenase
MTVTTRDMLWRSSPAEFLPAVARASYGSAMSTVPDTDAIEAQTQRIGRELAAALPSASRHPVRAVDTRVMELASSNQELKAALFRFVDVAPACHSLDDLARHLVGFLAEVDDAPVPISAAMRIAGTKAGRAALGAAAAGGVRHMAHRFIVGETLSAAGGVLGGLWERGVASSVDLLGEATVTASEADAYAARCSSALGDLSAIARRWPDRPALERDSAGPLPRANVSVKVSALTPLLRPDSPELGRDDAARRLVPLLRAARELGAHLHIDMESLDSREAVLSLVLELLSRPEFSRGPSAGLVLQAYLRDSTETLDAILEFARSSARTPPLVVRLVKGAYWDHELVQSQQHGWSTPVYESKADCDRNFEVLTARLLDAGPVLRVAIASHNLRSVSHAIAYNRATGGLDEDLEIQVLRGLGDELQDALATHALRVRTYCPVGNMVAGMAYLVRRLLENTSNDSFLQAQAQGVALEQLLAAP